MVTPTAKAPSIAPRPARDDANATTTKVGTRGYTISCAIPLNNATQPSVITLFDEPRSPW